MCRNIVLLAVVAWMALWCGAVMAGSVYTWTDADGVKRFSDSPPPEDAKDVQTIDEIPNNPQAEKQQRQDYNRMVDKASQAADRQLKEEAEKKAMEAEKEADRRKAELDSRVVAEREKLQKEIDAIKGRALGPTFSPGQKAAMIEKVQKKIDSLERDPKGYFLQ
ncbi:exported hypothetical protein [Desulfosarcina cetonica]|uniref:DUF4124 domain-containing protein n=1 Tax=Desulfosarcina cetonica TaxID=90730 RepID=UPI0006D2728F|nr:DUF4124 domain-containing protein [Desulfosarcina cetonica]VTR69392.1 exported hypothetical protein [Desulfosarcina cetonica]